ncbi:hypothetical protein C8J56DRAFT_1116714 [Mycena floridula]|nr:hypothetical protein C8J56DRAFT_1116714 [Mycena floridula]
MDATAQDQRLSRIGMVFYFNVTQYLVGSVLYGIHIVLFVMCMTKLLSRVHPIRSLASKLLIAAVLLLFLSTTLQFVLDVLLMLTQFKVYLINPSVPLEDRGGLWISTYLNPIIVSYWPVLINRGERGCYTRGIIWSTESLSSSARPTSVFLWVYAQALVSKHSKEGYEALRDKQLGTASSFLSLGTNVVATFCIGLKAWNHYRFTRRTSITQEKSDRPSQRSGMTEVTRILFVLIETGAIFAVVQLIVGVIIQVDMVTLSSLDLANDVINKAATYLAAILPTATIIIVRSNRSLESYSFTSSITPAGQVTKMSTIRFGESGPNETGFTTDSRVHHTDGNKSVNGSEKQEVV